MRKYRPEIRAQIGRGGGGWMAVQPYTAGPDFRYIIAKREPYIILLYTNKKLTNFSVFTVAPGT